jgi:hypothetical protein
VSRLNEIELLPTESTTYTLKVSNEIFTQQKDISVILHPMPTVNKISLPEIPIFDIPLPSLSLDTSYKHSISNQIKKATWYSKLFSLEFDGIFTLFNNRLQSINKRLFKILNQTNNE